MTAGRPLAVRSLVLLHDVLESHLIEVATWLLLRGFVDVSRTSSGMRYHKILLVAWAWHLRLHDAQIIAACMLLILLLTESKNNLVNDLVCWIWGRGLTVDARLNQIWTFVAYMLFIWMIITHRWKLLAVRGHRSMQILANLRVQVSTNTLLITAGNRAFNLFSTLTLTNVVT